MHTRMSDQIARRGMQLGILLIGFLLVLPANAKVDVSASITASGEGAIFDVRANGNGILQVATKAGRVGDRWRATIAQANGDDAVSAVGDGGRKSFSGWTSFNVKDGINYIVLVTYDRPLPGTFPAKVKIRFAGTSKTSNPPVIPLDGGPLKNIKARPIIPSGGGGGGGGGCPKDGSLIDCGELVTCELKPAGDTDNFKLKVPSNAALSINISGHTYNYWAIFDPQGNKIKYYRGHSSVKLPKKGTYTIEAYNSLDRENPYSLSVLGVSAAFSCGDIITPGGAAEKGKFEKPGDTDAYRLKNVKANQTYSINIAGHTYNYWAIFDPQGNLVKYYRGHSNVKLPVAGNYTIEVYNSLNREVAYTLSVLKVSG